MVSPAWPEVRTAAAGAGASMLQTAGTVLSRDQAQATLDPLCIYYLIWKIARTIRILIDSGQLIFIQKCSTDKFEMCSILSIRLSTTFVISCKSFIMRLHIIAINILLLIGSAM